MSDEVRIPTWGYKPDGKAEIFHLKRGEELPEGWASKPFPGFHPHDKEAGIEPAKAMAEPVKADVDPPRQKQTGFRS